TLCIGRLSGWLGQVYSQALQIALRRHRIAPRGLPTKGRVIRKASFQALHALHAHIVAQRVGRDAALEFQTLSFTTYATTELGHIPKKPGLQAVSTEPGFRELKSAFNLFKRRGVRVERHRASVEIHRPLHLCI